MIWLLTDRRAGRGGPGRGGDRSRSGRAGTHVGRPQLKCAETAGGVSCRWTDYSNAGGNQTLSSQTSHTAQITGCTVTDGDTRQYRIASSLWNNGFYASADAPTNSGRPAAA
jgi:hypothetical protein